MDGDLQHDPKYIRKMYNKLKRKIMILLSDQEILNQIFRFI